MAITITGVMTKTNGKGFKLDAHDGWVHLSTWAAPGTELPAVDERVTVTLDKAGCERKVELAAPPAAQPTVPSGPRPTSVQAPSTTPPPKGAVVTRLAVLNTASAILGGGPGHAVGADAVLAAAARLESWALR